MTARALEVDVLVVGGGVAGLWTLHALRRAGYSAILRTRGPLGDGQTISSQGIIHGGIKYALNGEASAASRAIARMPEIWNHCLNGSGEIDLRRVRILSPRQYLWTTGGLASKLMGVAASKAIRTPVERLDSERRPQEFSGADDGVRVYGVEEKVLDPKSLIIALADGIPVVDESTNVHARMTVWCAGSGNPSDSMQLRPLHMVMARSPSFTPSLPMVYGHCIAGNFSDKPRVTITSQRDSAGRVVWYIGGMLSESGVGSSSDELIRQAKSELNACVPWINLKGCQFATLRISRAEGKAESGRRPDGPVVKLENDRVIVWPTKLAFAPLAASMVVDHIRAVFPASMKQPETGTSESRVSHIADLPWERQDVQWN